MKRDRLKSVLGEKQKVVDEAEIMKNLEKNRSELQNFEDRQKLVISRLNRFRKWSKAERKLLIKKLRGIPKANGEEKLKQAVLAILEKAEQIRNLREHDVNSVYSSTGSKPRRYSEIG